MKMYPGDFWKFQYLAIFQDPSNFQRFHRAAQMFEPKPATKARWWKPGPGQNAELRRRLW